MVRQKVTNPNTNQPPPNTRGNSLGAKTSEALDRTGTEMPAGMEPKGNGWYGSPEVIDPNDCVNYPQSIFCGGNPLGMPRAELGLRLDWGLNGCGAWGSITPTAFGFTLPTHTRAWLRPECREDYEREELDRKNPPPPPPPDWSDDYVPKPQYRPQGFNLNDRVAVVTVDSYYRETQEYISDAVGWAIGIVSKYGTVSECNYPTTDRVTNYNQTLNPGSSTALASCKGRVYSSSFFNGAWVATNFRVPRIRMPPLPEDESNSGEQAFDLRIPYDLPSGDMFTSGPGKDFKNLWTIADYSISIWYGRFGDIFPRIQISPTQNITSYPYYRRRDISERRVVFCKKIDGSPRPWRPHLDVPPPPQRDCCMQCCHPQNQSQNDALLRQILKHLLDVKKTVGFDEFPAKVPETFLTAYDNKGKAQPPKQITLQNIPQLQAWVATSLEAVVGEMGAVIEIEDTDPTKEGNQPGKVIFKNLSELLLDTYTLTFDNWMLAHQGVQLQSKELIQSAMIHRTTTQNYFALLALIDFFGFKPKEVKRKLPFAVTIGAETIEGFMVEKEEDVLVFEFDPNDKNCRSYQDDMIELRHAAAMIRVKSWRKLNPNGDLGGQIIELVKMGMGYIDKIDQGKIDPRNPDNQNKNDFDKFCEDAETQFSRITGINPDKPYGVPYSNRPRITKLGGPSPDSQQS